MKILLIKHKASGTRLVHARGIAAVHYAAGMEPAEFGRQVIELIFKSNGGMLI